MISVKNIQIKAGSICFTKENNNNESSNGIKFVSNPILKSFRRKLPKIPRARPTTNFEISIQSNCDGTISRTVTCNRIVRKKSTTIPVSKRNLPFFKNRQTLSEIKTNNAPKPKMSDDGDDDDDVILVNKSVEIIDLVNDGPSTSATCDDSVIFVSEIKDKEITPTSDERKAVKKKFKQMFSVNSGKVYLGYVKTFNHLPNKIYFSG